MASSSQVQDTTTSSKNRTVGMTAGVQKSATATSQTGGSRQTSTTDSRNVSFNTNQSNTTGRSKSVTGATGTVNAKTQTAYDKVMNEYTPSPTVSAAYEKLQEILDSRPGAFSSKYGASLDNLYGQIMNRKDFSYNMNNDAMYNIYKDMYTQQGKSAMRDTVGQSAALTGGYNNSYATTAGNQAYQAYLERLNEIVPQLQQNAYNMYQDETSQLYNKANLTQSLYQQDYGQYRDKVSDWQKDRDYLTNYYNNERNFDYSKYNDNRNFTASEYWNQRNAERTTDTSSNQNTRGSGTSTSYGTQNTTSNTENWSNQFSTSESNNFTMSDQTTEGFQTSHSTGNSYSAGSGGSGGSGGSRSSSGGGESARSGATLDKGQRDTITLEGIQYMQNGGKLDDYLKQQVDNGRITEGDRAYFLGSEEYKKKSDAAYVKARG